jgi:hypothetical protein
MDKKILIIVAVVVLLLIGGGEYLVMSKQGPTPTPAPGQGQVIGKLSPDEIGLKMVLSPDKKKLQIVVSKANDIKSLDYEVTYDADIPASEQVEGEGGETRTTRGFSGDASLNGDNKYESKFFDLGSCSRNVCKYDTGVTEISVLMKVTKSDGKIYQVEDKIKV